MLTMEDWWTMSPKEIIDKCNCLEKKLDRAERALKRAGYQEPEWTPPLGLSVQAIRNAWLDAEVGGNSWDGAKAVLDLINKKEISTGKAFQMEPVDPGTMTQDEALDAVMASADQVEALARVLREAYAKHDGDAPEVYPILGFRIEARAAIAHLSKRPEVSTKPVDLWTVITSIVDVRVDCDGCDYVEVDRTSVSDLEVALRPWLRDPGGCELDVTAIEIANIIHTASVGAISETWKCTAAQRVLDLCRKRIRECKECAGLKQRLHHAAVAWNAVRSHEAIDALDAALEGE